MADDIVTRLREHDSGPWDIEPGVPCSLLREAADEIERLRDKVRSLQMILAIEADMDADKAKTNEERDAEVWVRPKMPRQRITSNIHIRLKEFQERYGGDINAWALDIAETVKRNMEAHRG